MAEAEAVGSDSVIYLAARISRSRKTLADLLGEARDGARVARLLGALRAAGHLSVFEHSMARVRFPVGYGEAARELLPWKFVEVTDEGGSILASLNVRTALEMAGAGGIAGRLAAEVLSLFPCSAGLDPGTGGCEPSPPTPGPAASRGAATVTPLVVSPHPDPRHGFAAVLVEGISRVTSHQLVRHRSLSFTQQSQRYARVGGYVLPGGLPPEAREAVEGAFRLYGRMVREGIPLEDARYVLPNAAETRIFVSGRASAWIHFLRLRLAPEAQWEIRRVAEAVREAISPALPPPLGEGPQPP